MSTLTKFLSPCTLLLTNINFIQALDSSTAETIATLTDRLATLEAHIETVRATAQQAELAAKNAIAASAKISLRDRVALHASLDLIASTQAAADAAHVAVMSAYAEKIQLIAGRLELERALAQARWAERTKH